MQDSREGHSYNLKTHCAWRKKKSSLPRHVLFPRHPSAFPPSPTPHAPPPVVLVVDSIAASNAQVHLLGPYGDLCRFQALCLVES
jgi:hypothetical protein